ncbi:hypothetical protein SEA_MEYRAN_51 [Gordonia phage Meyran]|nr:hypothetical protein SEA_MEYRAN_51 [Gordonia phage Meyran]
MSDNSATEIPEGWTRMRVQVAIDVDELRRWAERLADSCPGVAHVLYEAAARYAELADLDRASEYAQAGDDIVAEAARAAAKFPPFNSAHEGWAVLYEEVDEVWDEVRADNTEAAIAEAVQAGAMCLRFVADMRARLAVE